MNEKHANLNDDMLAELLKGCLNSYISILSIIPNTFLEQFCFPNQHQLAEVALTFKKEDEQSK